MAFIHGTAWTSLRRSRFPGRERGQAGRAAVWRETSSNEGVLVLGLRGCALGGNFEFLQGSEVGHFGGLGGPGGLGNPPERWGLRPPTFLKGFPGPRGRPDPQNDRFPILKQF